MQLSNIMKRMLGLTAHVPNNTMADNSEPLEASGASQQKDRSPVGLDMERILAAHRMLDRIYGAGFSKDNPLVVARFMTALALVDLADGVNTHASQLAAEIAGMREILSSGTGAITVGLDRG